MTNFEHMTEEEKKMAMLYGFNKEDGGELKVCKGYCTPNECPIYDTCDKNYVSTEELLTWIESDYEPPKTKNEKFCETLKMGEIIVVWSKGIPFCVRVFHSYDKTTDSIRCAACGYLLFETDSESLVDYAYGRKLTAEEKGE